MRKMLIAMAGVGCLLFPFRSASAQDEKPEAWRAAEQERIRMMEWESLHRKLEDRSPDLWYGTPGVRAGGDLLVPIRDLLRNPLSIFDFRPRKVASWLPDRETSECFREPR